jgi:DNA-binding LacI/PurR family transcriptional regulator
VGVATLADVARHAGVAASTVSYVLSGKRSVSEETRVRVRHSIEVLNYHPHAGARALASSKSNVLALIVPLRSDLYVPVMMEIAIAVVTRARAYGYDVLLLTNDEGPAGIHRMASSARADAIILTDIGMEDDRIATIRQTGVSAVLIGVPAHPAGLDCVDLDFEAAGRMRRAPGRPRAPHRRVHRRNRRRVPAASRLRRADVARDRGRCRGRGGGPGAPALRGQL